MIILDIFDIDEIEFKLWKKLITNNLFDFQKLLHKIYLKSYKNTDTEGGTVVAYLFIST